MATSQRYPLSTAEGQAIPLEVIKPLGVLRMPFTSSSFNSQSLTEDYQDKIFVASSTEDCYIGFASSPSSVSDNVITPSSVFIPAGAMIAFVINSLSLNVIGVSAAGVLHLQIADVWAGLALESQINRR